MTRKEQVQVPSLEMKVFHEDIYDGKEIMEVVSLRKNEVELKGDFSGGTNNTEGTSWYPIQGLFRLRKVCPQHEKSLHGCQLPNVHCQFPECEPFLSSESYYQKDGTKVEY